MPEPFVQMGGPPGQHRILSRPVGVRWAGWSTDTTMLQHSGWKLAVEKDDFRDEYRLLMHHQAMRLTAVTHSARLMHAITDPSFDGRSVPIFEVRHVAPTIEYCRIEMMGEFPKFQQIDATPRMTNREVRSIDDMNIFRLALDQAEEVVIDKADMSVIEHLQAIKDLQSETQRELRDKARRQKPEEQVSGEVVVQLIDYR